MMSRFLQAADARCAYLKLVRDEIASARCLDDQCVDLPENYSDQNLAPARYPRSHALEVLTRLV